VTARAFQPGAVSYDPDLARNYPAARAFSSDTAAIWEAAVRPFLPQSRPATILDVGCGTGRFSALFAERLQCRVVGIDPSLGMLQAAMLAAAGDQLCYVAARGECLPFAEGFCDLVWISQAIHHIIDREACAREIRRVLNREGCVLIRGAFGDRLDGYPDFYRFFSGARAIAAQFPSVDQVLHSFRLAGFSLQGMQTIKQRICGSLAELANRTRLRADSTLLLLPDSEFESCQAALEEAARREQPAMPVFEKIDLLNLRRPIP
jgi:ubiquinone/menaquinone biosynthesis C-methylase UbiE